MSWPSLPHTYPIPRAGQEEVPHVGPGLEGTGRPREAGIPPGRRRSTRRQVFPERSRGKGGDRRFLRGDRSSFGRIPPWTIDVQKVVPWSGGLHSEPRSPAKSHSPSSPVNSVQCDTPVSSLSTSVVGRGQGRRPRRKALGDTLRRPRAWEAGGLEPVVTWPRSICASALGPLVCKTSSLQGGPPAW